MFLPVRRCLLTPGLLALLLPAGCMHIFNPIPDPPEDTKQISEQLPLASRESVYVFLINGLDPLSCGNFFGIREFLNKLGYVRSYYCNYYQESSMVDEILELHREKPKARIVIVGYDLGADTALGIAREAVQGGAGIDVLMYIEPHGFSFDQVAKDRKGIRKVIVVRREKSKADDIGIPDAQVVNVACWNHHLVPTHPATLDLLATEMTNLAMSVPIPNEPDPPSFPPILDDPAPTPRPLITAKPAPRDEWDFLKLVSRHREPAKQEPKTEARQPEEKKATSETPRREKGTDNRLNRLPDPAPAPPVLAQPEELLVPPMEVKPAPAPQPRRSFEDPREKDVPSLLDPPPIDR